MQDIVLISLPKETLRHLVEDAVRKVFTELNQPTETITDEKPLSRREAATFLGIAASTLDNYRREGLITGERIRGSVRFHKKDLLASLSNSITGNKTRQLSTSPDKHKKR